MHRLYGDDAPPEVLASRRAAAAARRVVAGLAGTHADADTLQRVAERLEQVVDVLAPHVPHSRYAGTTGLRIGADADPRIWEHHPVLGPSHPLAPPLRIWRAGDRSRATATYGHAYEGPPGHVHGGILAAAFDIVLGTAAAGATHPALTGTLTVRYRRSTPLDTEVVFEGWVVRADERKVLVRAESRVGDEVTAEAEGVFVRIEEARLQPPAPPPTTADHA